MHLSDRAIQWFQWFEKSQKSITWKEFTYGFQMRSKVSAFEDAIGELTKLSQQSTVCVYKERFEELEKSYYRSNEEFFVSCFISGLCDGIKAGVQMFHHPTSLRLWGWQNYRRTVLKQLLDEQRPH